MISLNNSFKFNIGDVVLVDYKEYDLPFGPPTGNGMIGKIVGKSNRHEDINYYSVKLQEHLTTWGEDDLILVDGLFE